MKILVYPCLMEIGGSQLNALELADSVSKRGHDVVVFAPAGELTAVAEQMSFRLVTAPVIGKWPSFGNLRSLRRTVLATKFDVLHGYEWGPSVDLALGPHRTFGIPMVTTILSMSVPEFIPRHQPIIVGTSEIHSEQRKFNTRTYLMEPPIDTDANAPERDRTASRRRFGVDDTEILVSVVCRLSRDLGKLEGVIQSIDVVDRLAYAHPIRLLVVGDGLGFLDVKEAASAANRRHGREIITVAGPMLDPRPAYSAADIVIGMGSSALKGLAFGKPLVVQGASGFWRVLDEFTLSYFLDCGWWGHQGNGGPDLTASLQRLIRESGERERLGALGRDLAVSRFSLNRATDVQIAIYEEAIANQPTKRVASKELRRTALTLGKNKLFDASQRLSDRLAPGRMHAYD